MGAFPQRQIRGREPSRRRLTGPTWLDCRHIESVMQLAGQSSLTVWGPQDYAYFLAHDQGLCLGIFGQTGDLTAYFLSFVVQGDMDIVSLATHPQARRLGIAERLIREALVAPSVERVFLEVAVDNEAAIKLYKKLGFEITGTRRGYYEQKRDALVMAWGHSLT